MAKITDIEWFQNDDKTWPEKFLRKFGQLDRKHLAQRVCSFIETKKAGAAQREKLNFLFKDFEIYPKFCREIVKGDAQHLSSILGVAIRDHPEMVPFLLEQKNSEGGAFFRFSDTCHWIMTARKTTYHTAISYLIVVGERELLAQILSSYQSSMNLNASFLYQKKPGEPRKYLTPLSYALLIKSKAMVELFLELYTAEGRPAIDLNRASLFQDESENSSLFYTPLTYSMRYVDDYVDLLLSSKDREGRFRVNLNILFLAARKGDVEKYYNLAGYVATCSLEKWFIKLITVQDRNRGLCCSPNQPAMKVVLPDGNNFIMSLLYVVLSKTDAATNAVRMAKFLLHHFPFAYSSLYLFQPDYLKGDATHAAHLAQGGASIEPASRLLDVIPKIMDAEAIVLTRKQTVANCCGPLENIFYLISSTLFQGFPHELKTRIYLFIFAGHEYKESGQESLATKLGLPELSRFDSMQTYTYKLSVVRALQNTLGMSDLLDRLCLNKALQLIQAWRYSCAITDEAYLNWIGSSEADRALVRRLRAGLRDRIADAIKCKHLDFSEYWPDFEYTAPCQKIFPVAPEINTLYRAVVEAKTPPMPAYGLLTKEIEAFAEVLYEKWLLHRKRISHAGVLQVIRIERIEMIAHFGLHFHQQLSKHSTIDLLARWEAYLQQGKGEQAKLNWYTLCRAFSPLLTGERVPELKRRRSSAR